MAGYGPVSHFRVSLRTRMRITDSASGRETGAGEAEDGLRGDAAALTEQVRRYASAGVDELVIEPAATDLDDFLEQLTRFAGQVANLTRTGEERPGGTGSS
jgi:hypothetical protein